MWASALPGSVLEVNKKNTRPAHGQGSKLRALFLVTSLVATSAHSQPLAVEVISWMKSESSPHLCRNGQPLSSAGMRGGVIPKAVTWASPGLPNGLPSPLSRASATGLPPALRCAC